MRNETLKYQRELRKLSRPNFLVYIIKYLWKNYKIALIGFIIGIPLIVYGFLEEPKYGVIGVFAWLICEIISLKKRKEKIINDENDDFLNFLIVNYDVKEKTNDY